MSLPGVTAGRSPKISTGSVEMEVVACEEV
jgi:hypothetical protein